MVLHVINPSNLMLNEAHRTWIFFHIPNHAPHGPSPWPTPSVSSMFVDSFLQGLSNIRITITGNATNSGSTENRTRALPAAIRPPVVSVIIVVVKIVVTAMIQTPPTANRER